MFEGIRKAVGGVITRRPARKELSIGQMFPWVLAATRTNKQAQMSWNIYYDAMENETVASCISAIIMEILGANYEVKPDDDTTPIKQQNVDYLNSLFQYPNGLEGKLKNETYTTFMWKNWTSLLGTGDCFIEVAPNEMNESMPAGLYFTPPHLMQYDYNRDVWGYTGTEIIFEPDELIHVAFPDVRGGVWGKSPIDNIARSLTLDLLAWNYNKNFFKGGLSPKGYFNYDPDKITDAQYETEMQRIQTDASNNPRGTLFLYGGTYQDIGLTNRDMEFTTLMNLVRDRILGVYGVPPQKIGIFESGNLGSGRDNEADKSFWKKRKGEIKLFEDAFNNIISGNLEWDEKFRIGSIDLEDKKLRAETEDIRLKNYSTTINSIRAGYGEDPVAWGDEPFIPQNYYAPVGNPDAAGVKRWMTSKGWIKE